MPLNTQNLDSLRIDRSQRRPGGTGTALVVLILLVLAVAAVGGWWWMRTSPPLVRTTEAAAIAADAASSIPTLLNASGYITARREATVSSKVTGKVVEVLIEEGMRVTESQVLARLDAVNVRASLALAEARLEAARQAREETAPSLEQARREMRRLEQLLAAETAKQLELDRAATEVRTLEARLRVQYAQIAVAQRELAVVQQDLEDTIIRAPFAGIVTSKNAQPGEMISPISAGGGFTRTGICTLVDMTSLEIEVDVSESYINRVRPEQPVVATLDSYPDWRIPARVAAIIPTADRQKATVKVRVALDQLDPRILPDMSVKVAFQASVPAAGQAAEETMALAARGVTVPVKAVVRDGDRDLVWVVAEGRVERRAVRVGASLGDRALVIAGLRSGERVVVEPSVRLSDGGRVRESQP